ncbi:hypothetical protein [Rodentibacter haemolyticus]|nr:hypothetical protein [Rodentibacter haemolyticus]
MQQSIAKSGSQLATMAMKRVNLESQGNDILQPLVDKRFFYITVLNT